MQTTDIEFVDLLLIDAMSLARQAGAVHLRYFRGNELDVAAKLNDADIVTVADRAAERVVIDGVHALYPGHAILAEESGETPPSAEGFRWVIDPLDGTTNYAQGLPIFSVSIGVEHRGRTVAGVVYAPRLDEMFCATAGGGAYLNGVRISCSGKERLDQAVVSTGFPVDKGATPDNNLDNLSRIMPRVRGLRRLGSAAMDLCYVAAGFLDGFWELNLHHWDVCAGRLIMAEAGARCTEFRQDRNISIVAGTPAIHDQLLPLLSREPAR